MIYKIFKNGNEFVKEGNDYYKMKRLCTKLAKKDYYVELWQKVENQWKLKEYWN